ncbi:SGNH/GDSL hydrolase family protein [Secundilactobacillus kimchicus]|uniref:SGNH/GDSL hydrolase family protein n=1 Tax=Secundilactobacillus kimchicus TaxID=528209 RepID=UPI0024A97B86|nr:SGNH/GDSL hydrolase family protein [Secundilactobacillus kimchicus]
MKFIKTLLLTGTTLLVMSFSSLASAHATDQSLSPAPTMGFIGDSIAAGWTGTAYNLNQAYPDYLRQDLGLTAEQLINYSVPHARIVGNRYADCRLGKHTGQDMRNQILQHKTTIAHLKTLYLALGINDYAPNRVSGSLSHISQTLIRYIRYIKRLNPTIQLYGVLPLVGYSIHGNSFDKVPNDRHFTLKQLRTKLARSYTQEHVMTINPNQAHLITARNRYTTLADYRMHPTVATNQKLARYMANTVTQFKP